MKKTNKKQIPKVRMPKYSTGGKFGKGLKDTGLFLADTALAEWAPNAISQDQYSDSPYGKNLGKVASIHESFDSQSPIRKNVSKYWTDNKSSGMDEEEQSLFNKVQPIAKTGSKIGEMWTGAALGGIGKGAGSKATGFGKNLGKFSEMGTKDYNPNVYNENQVQNQAQIESQNQTAMSGLNDARRNSMTPNGNMYAKYGGQMKFAMGGENNEFAPTSLTTNNIIPAVPAPESTYGTTTTNENMSPSQWKTYNTSQGFTESPIKNKTGYSDFYNSKEYFPQKNTDNDYSFLKTKDVGKVVNYTNDPNYKPIQSYSGKRIADPSNASQHISTGILRDGRHLRTYRDGHTEIVGQPRTTESLASHKYGGYMKFGMGGMKPNAEVEGNEMITSDTPPQVFNNGGVELASNNPYGTPTYKTNGASHENGGIPMNMAPGSIINGKTKNPLTGNKFTKDVDIIAKMENKYTKKAENGDRYSNTNAKLILPILAQKKDYLNNLQNAIIANNEQRKALNRGELPQPPMDNEQMEPQGMSEQSEGEAPMARYGGMYAAGGIHINPANKGKFTASAQHAGMGTQEFASHVLANKEDYSSTQVKRANFAHNAAGWKHEMGGMQQYAIGGESEYGGPNDPKPFNVKDPIVKAAIARNLTENPLVRDYSYELKTGGKKGDELFATDSSGKKTKINFQDLNTGEYNPAYNDTVRAAIKIKIKDSLQKHALGGVQLPYYNTDRNGNPKYTNGGKMPKYAPGGWVPKSNLNYSDEPSLGYVPQTQFEANKMYAMEENRANPKFSTYNSDYENALQQTRDEVNAQQNKTNPPQEEELQLANDVIDKQHGWDHKNPKTAPGYKKQNLMNNIDWSKTDKLGNLVNFIGQNAGNIYDLTRKNEPLQKYERAKASYLDNTAAMRDAEQEARRDEYAVRGASGGNAGTYLANRVGLNTAKVMNKDRIRQQYANANAQIGNQNAQFNTEIAYREAEARAKDAAMKENVRSQAIASIGSSFGKATKSGKQDNIDQDTLKMFQWRYKNEPGFKKYIDNFSTEKDSKEAVA